MVEKGFIADFYKCEFMFYSDKANWLGVVLHGEDFRVNDTLKSLDGLFLNKESSLIVGVNAMRNPVHLSMFIENELKWLNDHRSNQFNFKKEFHILD